MIDLQKFCAPFADLSPGVIGLELRESLFNHAKDRKPLAAKYSVRRVLGIQLSLGNRGLDNAPFCPGFENPADR